MITAITCTGDRHVVFKICEQWMERQTVIPDQWIVVDDGRTPTQPCSKVQYVRRVPRPDDPPHTLGINLRAALPLIKGDQILFWEDDDYYKPTYIERMSKLLETNHIVGQPNAIYYNVQYRWWHEHNNTRHASLCQTGIRPNNLPYLETLCDKDLKYIDIELWKMAQGRHLLDDSPEKLCIGMKGLPGRGGIGSGHASTFTNDPDYSILKRLLGKDADVYFDLLNIRPETIPYPKEIIKCRRDALGRLILPKPNKQIESILDAYATRVEPLTWILHSVDKRRTIGDMKNAYKDKVCYIIGKGPSMDKLTESNFEADCPIIGLNQAIHKIESLSIKNNVYCVQQDSQLREICWSKRGTMLLPYITSAWYSRHPDVVTYNMEDFGIPNNFHPQSICMATHIAKLWGCKKIIFYGCDSFISGDIKYANSLNYDIRTKEQLLRANIGEQKRTLDPILVGVEHEFRLAQ